MVTGAEETGNPSRVAVLLPGGNYSTDGPLLMYAGLAVQRRGGQVHRAAWSLRELPPSGPAGPAVGVIPQQIQDQVTAQASVAIDAAMASAGAAAPLIVGKSLGSLAAAEAADRGLPAIWFTPALTDESVVAGLRRASAPFLLVGGSADRLWDGTLARSLTANVVEVDGADHGMFVPGPLSASAAVLGQVMDDAERFLDRIVWP